MDLQRPGWFREFLYLLLADYQPERAWARVLAGTKDDSLAEPELPRLRALRHLDIELRRSGLIFGSPKLPSRITQGTRLDRSDAHFLSVLAGECFVALDVARNLGLPFEADRSHAVITCLLAAAVGRVDLATSVAGLIEGHGKGSGSLAARLAANAPTFLLGSQDVALSRLQERLEKALVARVALATADTTFDLPLHNSRVFGEARLMGRLAIDFHASGGFRPHFARRLLAASRRERAGLLPALVAPARLQRDHTDAERRAVTKELRALRLPRALSQQIRQAIDAKPSPVELAKEIRTRSARRFALDQAWLATMIGGVDEAEDAFLAELAEAFGFPEDVLEATAAEVADYFYDPDEIIDSFEIRAKAQETSGKLADRIERDLLQNLDRIALEVKETGELAQLLGKAAMGQKLTRVEREKAREQLIDLAKVVPSLAIFAAPGGMLILAALVKVLPFSLLPSAFQRQEKPASTRRPSRLRIKSRRRSRG